MMIHIKNIFVVTIILLLILIILFLLYFYPIQRYLAEKSLEEYMTKQEVSTENIQSKKVLKDYKQGGYLIEIIYKDDPEILYSYLYVPRSSTIFSGRMVCIVYKKDRNEIDPTQNNIKYPPIE